LKGPKALIGVAISVGLLGYLVWSVDVRELMATLARTRWQWVVVASLFAPVGVWARARRWWYLFPPRSEPPALVPATMIGYMVNNVLPLRAGEVVRVWVVARRWGHGFWTTLATLIVERVLDSVFIVLIMVVLVMRIAVPRPVEVGAGLLLAVDLLAISVLGMLAVAPDRTRGMIERLTRPWPSLQRRIVGTLETFARGLEGVCTRAHLMPLLAWTAAIWILPTFVTWTMFRALDLEVPWIAAFVVLAFAGIGVAIPSAPGYVGVFHAAATLALTIFGVPASTAFGYALLLHATQILPITLVGWIYLLREHVNLSDATRSRPVEIPCP
jgi:glycosyltransferase 2 family protein